MCAVVLPPELKVTMGNVLLVRVPTLSYVTGDSLASNFLRVECMEVDCGDHVTVSVPPVCARPVRAGTNPAFSVYYLRGLAGVGPLRPSSSYRVRTVLSRQPGMACPFVFQQPQDATLTSGWSTAVNTLPAR